MVLDRMTWDPIVIGSDTRIGQNVGTNRPTKARESKKGWKRGAYDSESLWNVVTTRLTKASYASNHIKNLSNVVTTRPTRALERYIFSTKVIQFATTRLAEAQERRKGREKGQTVHQKLALPVKANHIISKIWGWLLTGKASSRQAWQKSLLQRSLIVLIITTRSYVILTRNLTMRCNVHAVWCREFR